MKRLAAPRLSVLSLFSLPSYIVIGPYPAHDVVVIAVRNAVSAATMTFTATSTILFFFILEFIFFLKRIRTNTS